MSAGAALVLCLGWPGSSGAQSVNRDPVFDYDIAPVWEGDWRAVFSSRFQLNSASGTVRIEQTKPRTFSTTAQSSVFEATTGCQVGDAGQALTGPMEWVEGGGLRGIGPIGIYDTSGPTPRCTDRRNGTVELLGGTNNDLITMWDGDNAQPIYSLQRISHPEVPYVALGDSYSSGEGASNYDPEPKFNRERCHRSAGAWPRLLAKRSRARSLLLDPRLTDTKLVACSGATTQAINGSFKNQEPQIDSLPLAGFVTLTLGGNDVDFSPTLRECFSPLTRGGCLAGKKYNQAIAKVRGLVTKLPPVYKQIAGKLVDPRRLVVVGYPDLFANRNDTCGWLTDAELVKLNALESELERALQSATAAAGVRFVSVFATSNNHQMCTKSSNFVDISGRQITVRGFADLRRRFKIQELGHPRTTEQQRIADAVALALGLTD